MQLSRRSLLTGLGVGGALVVGWALWPKTYAPNLPAAPGETVFNPWLKIGADGQVTVIVPEIEMGQGSYTLIPQLVADELGADWRTIAVEPAPLSPAYANRHFAAAWHEGPMPVGSLQVSDGSATVRDYEGDARAAAAAARALLCLAAAGRLGIDWRACDTEGGFVVRGEDRFRFGELAAEAAALDVPADAGLRVGGSRLAGRGMNRLDGPAKIDGTATFAADVRLPDMVYAAVRQGPVGDSRLLSVDNAAADRVFGVSQIVRQEGWVAAIANSWWAANKAVEAMRPRFETRDAPIDDSRIARALDQALAGPGERVFEAGDLAQAFANGKALKQRYVTGLAPHAVLEPPACTAAIREGRLELWVGAQLPRQAVQRAAAAIGFDVDDVILHPVFVGGSFGRKFDNDVAVQAAILAHKLNRPVQLAWSRAEEARQDRFGSAAVAHMAAKLGPAGRIEGWHAKIAAPDAIGQLKARVMEGKPASAAGRGTAAIDRAVAGAIPPYGVGTFAIDHHPVDYGVAVSKWRSDAHVYTGFFTESFIDELSRESGVEPFSFRMALLGANPRLALCLSKVATRGGWQGGGEGTGQGLACHAMPGAYIAVLAEAGFRENGQIEVTRLVAVADIGRVLNPDLARQQIEGGLLFGMARALGAPVRIEAGVAEPARLGAMGLPRLADSPDMEVELIVGADDPGPVGEIGVPAVAPAIANALYTSGGRRLRTLPFGANVA